MSKEEVTVRYFAAVREIVGREVESLAIDEIAGDEATVGAVWEMLAERHPELEGLEAHVRVAVNRDFADREATVEAGDEVALIPPVSGGAGEEPEAGGGAALQTDAGRFKVTETEIAVGPLREIVARPEAGAIVAFEGVVRDHTDDHEVEFLEYECYAQMALEKLVEVAEETADRWPTVEVAIHHRYGRLEIGQTAVAIAVSSPHRDAGFSACRHVIDQLKEVVPIWKKEVGPDGEAWVGWGP